jgi:transcriptional regulator CtsR
MRNLSDLIESYLLELLQVAADEGVEIQRNQLAARFECVPSQINYVLQTRFNLEHGYIVISRRGGGGYVKIVPLGAEEGESWPELLDDDQEELNLGKWNEFLTALYRRRLISRETGVLLSALAEGERLEVTEREAARMRHSLAKSLVKVLQEQGAL